MNAKLFDTLIALKINPYGRFDHKAINRYWDNQVRVLWENWNINLNLCN
jgi:hypothetical protein